MSNYHIVELLIRVIMNENVQTPSFPKVNLTVEDGDGNIIIVKTHCQPHELSAVLAIYQPEWTICLKAVE